MQLSLSDKLDDITLLNRLTLNKNGSVDEEMLYNILKDCDSLFIFRKIIKSIVNIKANHIETPDYESDKTVFKLKFDDTKSAKAICKLINKNEFMIANHPCTVNVEQTNNKLRLVILQ